MSTHSSESAMQMFPPHPIFTFPFSSLPHFLPPFLPPSLPPLFHFTLSLLQVLLSGVEERSKKARFFLLMDRRSTWF